MHEDVLWFDTAACWKGSFIGDANKVVISPDNSLNIQYNKDALASYPVPATAPSGSSALFNAKKEDGTAFGDFWASWYTGAAYDSRVLPLKDYDNKSAYNPLAAEPFDTKGPYQVQWKTSSNGKTFENARSFRSDAWDVSLKVVGDINWNNKQITTDLWAAKQDLIEDCDMDCQKRGSQLTVVAQLMGAAYGIIAFNALCMFIGTWRYRWRICSVYCTMVACVLQLTLSIVAATMLFTKYNNVCMRSLTNTFDGMRWTMNDDFTHTFNLWVASLILMLPFVCCGMCSSYISTE